jgi:ribose 1,5-bisphosphate isomerase
MLSYFKKKQEFNKIAEDIKLIKIQGARNVAKAALEAYSLVPFESSIKKLKSLRPTEPMLFNVLDKLKQGFTKSEILVHFDSAQDGINYEVLKLIKNNDIIFTHCHSTNVVNSLIYSKKKGKHFQIYNTETRPLFQGRKTAKDLLKHKIPVTMFVDSALGIALSGSKDLKKPTKIFLGADALLENGIINKVGSNLVAQIAHLQKIPVYIIADSWKFSNQKIPIEQRGLNEVWDRAPKHIKIKNPAFEFVSKRYIKAIISEKGNLTYDEFLKKVK